MDSSKQGLSANEQIKSRERVSAHGEVYTAEREINAMLNLVKNETERIDSRFLEPACGNGNFLSSILSRKLAVVSRLYAKNKTLWQYNSLIAIGSIYGIEILHDNVLECRERLYNQFYEIYKKKFSNAIDEDFCLSVRYVIDKNIVWGDALTYKQPDSEIPIVFAEWSALGNMKVKRRDFSLSNILLLQETKSEGHFSDLFSSTTDDVGVHVPLVEFTPIHYLKIHTL